MTHPLSHDVQGNPIDIPAQAVSWRVRRVCGRRGPHQAVYDPETGAPLLVDITATVEDLKQSGCEPGRYRLDACDAEGTPLGVMAYTEIAPDEASRAAAARGVPPEMLSLLRETIATLRSSNERLTETMVRALEALAGAFGPVRPPKVQIEAVEVPAEALPREAPDYMPLLLSVAQQLVPMAAQFLSARAGAGAPSATAAMAATPTGDAP
jgi:hypothetical protein